MQAKLFKQTITLSLRRLLMVNTFAGMRLRMPRLQALVGGAPSSAGQSGSRLVDGSWLGANRGPKLWQFY